jgi:murein DD-endopeptidase MepM/ murein hydrolase activator NlpD
MSVMSDFAPLDSSGCAGGQDGAVRIEAASALLLAALGAGADGGLGPAARTNPYEAATADERARFKRIPLPLPSGTRFVISQGAFGRNTHHDPGHEYTWDFDVPYGTPALAVEDGVVIQVWQPNHGGGCDSRFSADAHNIKIRHRDGTVAQYVHIQTSLQPGDRVRRGQQVAKTAQNGFICTPQLDFGVYLDDQHLFGSGQPRTIPALFEGLPEGVASEGFRGVAP